MALASASSLSIHAPALRLPSSTPLTRRHSPRLFACCSSGHLKWQKALLSTLAATAISFSGTGLLPAVADLNKFEAELRGEFGIGSAAQFGSADLRKAVHVNENFRRANFTSADMRESDFSGCSFNGAYLEKAVAYKANFSGADLSDTLMDRMLNYLVPHRTTCKSSILRQKQKLNPIKCQNMWAEWNGKYHDDIRRFMKMILQYT